MYKHNEKKGWKTGKIPVLIINQHSYIFDIYQILLPKAL